MKRRKTNGAIAALASLILAAGTAIIGQTVDVAGKISAGVQQALADGATTLPVFIELASQPQAEILQRDGGRELTAGAGQIHV